ncbi:MAG: class A beta-lactamase [Xanthomonadales bacterium]|nr:class A beta-lactamase [Xanthomonadales bacterium]
MRTPSITRRQALHLLTAAGASALVACAARDRNAAGGHDTEAGLRDLERTHGGRLGVFALDTGSGKALAWRADQRFALCSTFKLLLAGMVLHMHQQGSLDGDSPIGFSAGDLVPHAPVIQARLDAGIQAMSALELARATQVTSDNVAANLLVRRLGGPRAVTAYWRDVFGDSVSRLDRWEPEMNRVGPGEERDTTTPRAIAGTTARLLGGDLLAPRGRRQLEDWLVETGTGLKRLRAGLPPDWRAGDKTGTAIVDGLPSKYNDVAVAWPPQRAPLVIACYYEADGHHPRIRPEDEAVHAKVARLVAEHLLAST